ncbi:hypothetical protein [Methanolobus sp. ZRKC5]|uniref:hypothetical protein n=1 Tax=unclassified Methanolobus TaxID=2629569 RepID=UPI00313C1336
MKTNVTNNVILLLVLSMICVVVMSSGCMSNTDLGADNDNKTPEQILPEVDQDVGVITDDEDQILEETQSEDTPTEVVLVDTAAEEVSVSEQSSEQSSSTASISQSVPHVTLQASALGDARYLFEHQNGDDMDLGELRLIISSHGSTAVYSPITENHEIMNKGDQMIIDVNSGTFTINDDQVTVTIPETTDSSVVDTSIILFHIGSDQMIAYMTVSG